MAPVSTVRAPHVPTADEDAGPQRLGIMLVATPVAAARWQTHVVKSTHVVERVAQGDVLDDQMSRRHSTVRRRGDHLTLRDGAALDGGAWKPSSNGTHGPDGALLAADEEVVLHRGDTFRTGQSLWVVIENPTPPIDPDTLLPGPSPSMRRLREEIAVVVAMVAARLRRGTRVHQALLVTGPRGSGKQVVAQEAHRLLSKQLGGRQTPFRQVAAPSLADGTVAADLFGVVDGYATGTKGRPGYFVQAHRGILLLDEVGDTPASAQARLLNALQEREVTPLGGRTPIPFDCLVIGATNRELKTIDDDESSARGVESGEGRTTNLRADLIDRLARFRVSIPPLRERREDIPMILDALLARHGVERALAAPLVHTLMTRWWSGNVRELDSVIERLVALSTYRSERPSMDLLRRALPEEDSPSLENAAAAPPPLTRPVRARPTEAELIEALEETGWNRSEVARRFGRDPRQVRRWIALYGLEQPAD